MNVEEIKKVAVIGAGLMGHGIAQEFALAGYDVHLHDANGGKLRNAEENIRNNLDMLTGLGLITKEQAVSSRRHIAGWDLISAICRNLFPNLDASTEILLSRLWH